MANNVNLITGISGGNCTIGPMQIKIPIRIYEITQFFIYMSNLVKLTADSFTTMYNPRHKTLDIPISGAAQGIW